MPKLALKIDVNTYRGTLQGVPVLVDILRRNRATASFMFALGPDHTGRSLNHLFRPGFIKQMQRTSLIEHYGLQTMLYGTLLPGPDIGRRCADILRATQEAGFETAIHCWDRIKWQEGAELAEPNWTETEMHKAHERFIEIFGTESPGHGAAGWQMNHHALRLTQRLGYRWSSDCRGTHPFIPVWNGEVVHCMQLPTTLPTIDELIGFDGTNADNVHQHLLRLTAESRSEHHVVTLQAELGGLKFAQTLEVLLTGWREQGYELVSLGELAESLDAADLPRHEILRGEIPGHPGTLMVQGEEHLSSWRKAA